MIHSNKMSPRHHAMVEAKSLCRTLPSAPSPRERAQAILTLLMRVETWSPAQEARIIAFSDWLATRPHDGVLRDKCKQLLAGLS